MPTNPKLKVENLFEAALTAPVASATGDVTLSLTVAPANPFGGLVIDPDDSGKRETVIYHAKSGLDVSVYGVNRTNGNTHLSGAAVKMLNLAELFNLMSGMVSWTFFTFQRSALDVTVNGGPVAPGLTASDTDITVGNGTTYLWFNPSDSSVNSTQNASVVTAANGITFATVVAGGGSISSITYERFVTGSFLFSSMRDVSVSGATDGQILEYDSATQKWVPGTKYFALDSLTDVNADTPTDGYVLSWDAGTSKYVLVPQNASGISDAPSDGTGYVRKNGAWAAESGGGGAGDVMLAGDNAFTGDNTFAGTSEFNETVTFDGCSAVGAFVNPTPAEGSVIVDFTDANFAFVEISSATAVTIQGMRPGNAYSVTLTNSGGGSISALTLKQISGATLLRNAPGGAIPDVSETGIYVLTLSCGSTGASIYSSEKATLIT